MTVWRLIVTVSILFTAIVVLLICTSAAVPPKVVIYKPATPIKVYTYITGRGSRMVNDLDDMQIEINLRAHQGWIVKSIAGNGGNYGIGFIVIFEKY